MDVTGEIEIAVPRAFVAAFACDPDNAMEWYDNVRAVEWRTPRPVAIGSQVAFVARVWGRNLTFTNQVTALVAGEKFVMTTSDAPFPVQTTYTWQDTSSGGTLMRLRIHGELRGFAKPATSLLARSAAATIRKDLATLQRILENSTR